MAALAKTFRQRWWQLRWQRWPKPADGAGGSAGKNPPTALDQTPIEVFMNETNRTHPYVEALEEVGIGV